MKIRIEEVRRLMEKALHIRKVDKNVAKLLIDDLIEAQMENTFSHGIAKFLLIDAALKERIGSPIIKEKKSNYALIDGNKELGHAAADFCINVLAEMVKENAFAIVGLVNSSRYGRLKPFARMIADKGLIGIIMNNGGPSAVAPYGGSEPILGTNPLCFAFPAKDENIILDFSTSKYAWGKIRESILENKELPPEGFMDENGDYTTSYKNVNAVDAFGDAKGYALCLAIEILTGAFLGTTMGKELESQYEGGFLFIAMNPNMFTSLDYFKEKLNALCVDIRNSKPKNPKEKVYVPGDKSNENYTNSLESGEMELNESIYDELINMSKHINCGLESTNITD